MLPAYSVIFFTVASGAGYGLLVWLAIASLTRRPELSSTAGLTGTVLALILVSGGLLASTFHLGHPERSWRAFSQWRTSWLSREGVLAVLAYGPALVFTAAWIVDLQVQMVRAAAIATIALALATVVCTSMIYASLKPIPRWRNPWVPAVYLLLGLTNGMLIFFVLVAFTRDPDRNLLFGGSILVIVAWLVKIAYWRHIDLKKPISTAESVTGLGDIGTVRQFEGPHTSDNFVMQEMGYRIARKHADRLRGIALFTGAFVPVVSIMVSMMTSGMLSAVVLVAGALSGFLGVAIERWLFIAEAKHVVTLYYGETRV